MTIALLPNDPRIHVFALRPGPMRLTRRTYLSGGTEAQGDTPLAKALGAEVDPANVEVFSLSDVAPLGLRDYLAQAHDIPQAVLAPDRARLDATRGQVVIVSPRGVQGLNAIEPDRQLVHLGSYEPARTDDAPRELPRADRTAPQPRSEPAPRGGPSRGTILWIVAAALVLAVLAVALL